MDTERKDKKKGYFKLITQEKAQHKELELISNEFYYCKTYSNNKYIFQKGSRINKTDFLFCLDLSWHMFYRDFIINKDSQIKELRLATKEEKQLLIEKVEKETSKVWNEETKTFEDKPKYILVPENIKIIKYQNNQLGLVFNDNKQVLTFSEGVYIVMPFDKLDKFISCRLEKTTFEKLEIGNIFCIYDNIEHELNYRVKISDSKCTWVGVDLFTTSIKDYSQIVYKLISIK